MSGLYMDKYKQKQSKKETAMKWETPKATDLRFGFEITMYISNR